MSEIISLDMLNKYSVSLKKQQVVTLDGVEYPTGETWRRAYVNSSQGRAQVEEEVPEPYKSVIMLMWGDTPTVAEMTE